MTVLLACVLHAGPAGSLQEAPAAHPPPHCPCWARRPAAPLTPCWALVTAWGSWWRSWQEMR